MSGDALQPWHCGAMTRAGRPCRKAKMRGKRRCHMHGGARCSGGQPGNTNAWKHGYYSAGAIAERKRLAKDIRWIKRAMKALRADGRTQGTAWDKTTPFP